MARPKSKASESGTTSGGGGDVKMIQRHTEYQEADVEATQEAEAGTVTAGPNPHRKGTAAWSAHENRKRQDKGLPATNSINE